MSKHEQELVLTSGHKDSLLADQGDFKYRVDDLQNVVNMDNRYELEVGGTTKISSDMIVNKFGGIENIASGL